MQIIEKIEIWRNKAVFIGKSKSCFTHFFKSTKLCLKSSKPRAFLKTLVRENIWGGGEVKNKYVIVEYRSGFV